MLPAQTQPEHPQRAMFNISVYHTHTMIAEAVLAVAYKDVSDKQKTERWSGSDEHLAGVKHTISCLLGVISGDYVEKIQSVFPSQWTTFIPCCHIQLCEAR